MSLYEADGISASKPVRSMTNDHLWVSKKNIFKPSLARYENRFTMSIEPYNTYILVNVKSGTALDLSGTDGYTVSGWERHGGENQRWTLEKFEDTNQWTFRNVYSGKYLGLAELSELRDDIPIQGVDYPVPWDIFEDELDRSTYRIVVPETSFNVDLSNFGDPNNGTLVAIWGQWEALNQTWRFEQVYD